MALFGSDGARDDGPEQHRRAADRAQRAGEALSHATSVAHRRRVGRSASTFATKSHLPRRPRSGKLWRREKSHTRRNNRSSRRSCGCMHYVALCCAVLSIGARAGQLEKVYDHFTTRSLKKKRFFAFCAETGVSGSTSQEALAVAYWFLFSFITITTLPIFRPSVNLCCHKKNGRHRRCRGSSRHNCRVQMLGSRRGQKKRNKRTSSGSSLQTSVR